MIGCAPGDQAPEVDDDGALRGELAIYVADDFQGRSAIHYALRMSTGEERPLSFDGAVDMAPGARIEVRGPAIGDGIHVTSFRSLLAPISTRRSALINGAPYEPRSFAL